MNTKSQEMIKLVKDIASVQALIKAAVKQEKEFKDQLKLWMASERLLTAGDYCVLIETRNRTALNQEALMHDMGVDFMKKYQVRSEYETMIIRPIQKVG